MIGGIGYCEVLGGSINAVIYRYYSTPMTGMIEESMQDAGAVTFTPVEVSFTLS